MAYIYWLSQIQSVERSLVGDKLFIFSQLLQHECPILPGFVISNDLWQEFIIAIGDRLSVKDCPNDDRQRQAFARHSRQIVEEIEIPQTWQSEIWAAAQQLNSPNLILQPFLTNAYGESLEISSLLPSPSCNCNLEAINSSIKSIWLELFSATSLIYRQKLGLTCDRLNLSILIRPLQSVYASGTIAIDQHFIQIEATWGLEQSLIWGDVEADRYYLDRDLGQIISQSLGQKNYAYRSKQVEETIPITNCLEAYLPPAEMALASVLDAEAIAQLHQLTDDILKQQPQVKYLVWTAFKSTANNTLQFYWTQLSDRLTLDLAIADRLDNLSELKKPLLSGIALSSGTIQSEVVVIRDLDTQTQIIQAGTILVTKAIDPQHIALIKQVKGIITEVGGRNSHAGIVARELNIPAIANVEKATEILKSGDRILLDGDRGRIYEATAKHQIATTYKVLAPSYPIATKLMVNLSQPGSIPTVSRLPLDGVGLLRSELMLAELLASKTLAQWQESFQRQFTATLCDYLRQFGAAFAPRPVFYRSLDLYARSGNPLGDRGTYSYLTDPTLFNLELEALQTVIGEGYQNLNLLLPFVRSVNEFQFCYRRLQQLDLTTQDSFQVWIMAEVPSVAALLPEYVRAGVQGIAIGTNDLTQLLLGVDREQIQFSDRGLNANHPAMHQAIGTLIETAHQYDIECCICGQAPVEHPDLIERLIGWGIDSISVEPDAVEATYKAIARAEKRLLLKSVNS